MRVRSGFTLIELLVVVGIIGVLAAAGFAAYSVVLKNARDGKRQGDLKLIQSGLENYFADWKKYPLVNVTGVCGNGTLKENCPLKDSEGFKTYLNQVPKDPASGNPYLYKPLKSDGNDCTLVFECMNYCIYAKGENVSEKIETSCANDDSYNIEVTTP